jgi:hypothetical protein
MGRRMADQNDFFTWQSLATFAGTSTVTTAVTNGVCAVFSRVRPAAVGLGTALLLCLVVALVNVSTGQLDFVHPFATYLIAIINGFFVFTSAAGLSSGGKALFGGASNGQPKTPSSTGDRSAAQERRLDQSKVSTGFFRSWF